MTSSPSPDEPASRLWRRLGTADAVVIGLGAMVGAGVFAALAPAAGAAGSGLLLALALAGAVAYANATSSAQLAALYPQAGGTYVYGRERLGPFWGALAGWSFLVGKTASCAAMALTFGSYAAPSAARPVAVAAVLAVTAVNLAGIRKTAVMTRLILAFVLTVLAVVFVAGIAGGTADVRHLSPEAATGGARGLLQAAGFLFFAFAGYARIATLGEEVAQPARTIPRAIRRALLIASCVYLAVAVAALLAVGPGVLAPSSAPLVAVVEAGRFHAAAPLVRAGAVVAALGALLSLIVGVSRTTFAMAGNGDLPPFLAAVHPRTRVPHRAEIAVGGLVVAVLLAADVRGAIGFSSFGVLVYYGITNACAVTLSPGERRNAPAIAWAGIAGCGALALSLPPGSVVSGMGVLATGALAYAIGRMVRARRGR